MARGKKHTPEQVVNLLRQIEVAVANGKTTSQGVQGSGDHRADVLPLAQGVRRVAGGPGAAAEGAGAGEREAEAAGRRAEPGEAGAEGHRLGKLLSPERRRCAVDHAQEQGMSERRACRLVNQPRGTQRYQPTQREDEDALTRAIVELASQYGRYGYRRITALLKRDGWQVGKDRVERIWRREGLKVPQKQKPRGRLWFNDGSCVRLRPERTNHVWSYDFVSARTHDGRTVRMLNLIDEHTREGLLVRAERRWSSAKVIEALADVMVIKGVPEHIRSDNGPEFVARDCASGWPGREPGRCTSNRVARGRTATARASTRSCGTSS